MIFLEDIKITKIKLKHKLMNDINIEDYKKYLEEYMFLKDVKNFNL